MSELDALLPERTALLVTDMQNAFCHPEGTLGLSGVDVRPAQDAIEPVRELVLRFREASLPVLWSQQEHFAEDASRAKKRLASHTAKRKQIAALSGSWDMALVDELAPLADDPSLIIRKHRFGCFHQTRLDQVLRMLGVEALIVTGTTANACVETTLREAYLRDYDVVAVTDCIAAVRPEWEATAHAVWSQYLGILTTSRKVIDWLDRALAPRARALGHLLLQTTDLERAESFYIDLLGLTVRSRDSFRDGRPLVITHEGLGLTNGRPDGPGPVEHLAFRARGVRALAERAHSEGITITRGPEPSNYGTSVYLLDPDGNQIELYEDEPGAK
ncbi:MAG TPA: isochorismatase family protein [Gaiellaceae bacterium]|nr:isochorismatase family protein [Gaiellaceae bacterium]